MTLTYVIAFAIALVAYALMGNLDSRLRIAMSLGILIGLVGAATWLIVRVGDEARAGSSEVPTETPASKPSQQESDSR